MVGISHLCDEPSVFFPFGQGASLDTIAYRTLSDANLCDITYHHEYNNKPATKSYTESPMSLGKNQH